MDIPLQSGTHHQSDLSHLYYPEYILFVSLQILVSTRNKAVKPLLPGLCTLLNGPDVDVIKTSY